MSSEKIWGGIASMQGSIQAITEYSNAETLRANKAEANLAAAQRQIRSLVDSAKYYTLIPAYEHNQMLRTFVDVVLTVLDAEES